MSRGFKRKGFSLVEALVSIALTGIGVAAVMGAIGSMTNAQTRLLDRERMQLLAVEKFDELVATGDFDFDSSGDFVDRGEDRYEWTSTVATTGIENLSHLRVVVRPQQDQAQLEVEVSGLVFDPPPATGDGLGATP
jgi:prepilin-type N-terminal cleavage/methylation domain-containing protein